MSQELTAEHFKPITKNKVILPALICFTIYAFFSTYMWITILAGITIVVVIAALYKPYVPPVLVYLFGIHWLQVYASVAYAEYSGGTLEEVFQNPEAHLDLLFVVTLFQIIIMAIYLSRVFKIKFKPSVELLREASTKLNIRKIIYAYIIASIIFPSLIASTYSNSSLNQVVQSFAVIRKVLLLMLIFIVFLRKTQYNNLIIVFIILEFILSFASYFSNFKEIILFVGFVYLTVKPEVKTKQVVRLTPLIFVLFAFLIFWSSVKEGYRNYLNQGTRQQQVNVSREEALNYLFDKTGEFTADSFKVGTEKLLYRAQYMQQYSSVYERVPAIIPHTNGDNLSSTISFLLMPRFLNPGKTILDPSSKTSFYTGKTFANASQGTSISMGYFCDLYIDFGLWIMIIPLLVLTFFIGKVSNYIINSDKYNMIFTYSLFIGTILSLGTFESDIIFYMGTVRNYTVFMLLGNFFLFPFLNKYIKA